MPSNSKRSTTSKKAKAKTVRKAPAKPKKTTKIAPADATHAFTEAIALFQGGYVFDAVKKFQEIAKDDGGHELADDALVNAGLCYMHMALYRDAIAQFSRVVQGYPNSTISGVFNGQEVGRTAAKALLNRIRCHLMLGDADGAKKDHASLKKYSDSYVLDSQGGKKTFFDVANEILAGKQGP